jgi:2,3-bisphosphoglycerate-dependent phosphoglycerate mutase
MHRFVALSIAILLTAAASFAATTNVTTVILVRHGEKVTEGMADDPPLSAAGVARAAELARVLADANVAAIYTTPFLRTRNTAAPIAAALKLTPIEVAGGKSYPADVVAKILADHAGETVLVVGHSNTTPDVLRRLGIANPPAIADSQYDDLFVVTLAKGAPARLVRLRYGAAAR